MQSMWRQCNPVHNLRYNSNKKNSNEDWSAPENSMPEEHFYLLYGGQNCYDQT